MPSEREKMLAGELYDPLDAELVQARERARDLCQDLNATRERDQQTRRRILMELFGNGGESVWMQPPFFCDYGSNILLGRTGVLQFQLRRPRRVLGEDWRLHAVRTCGPNLHRYSSDERRTASETGIRQAHRDRL